MESIGWEMVILLLVKQNCIYKEEDGCLDVEMTLNFTKRGEVHVLQNDHIEDIIADWPEDLSKGSAVTPASNNLFKKGDGKPLENAKRRYFTAW